MELERLRRVTRLWSWLPAFRAVAETQHLPTASQQLFVSPSALSRTIRLLEEDVGHRLFLRGSRRIELNDAGQRFLLAVRDAMRIVHDGLLALDGSSLVGPVWVSSVGLVATAHVLPALQALRRSCPDLLPCLREEPLRDPTALLLRGELDVAFVTESIASGELSRTHVGTASASVYCGLGHPLHDAADIEQADLVEHPFVALATSPEGASLEGWPSAIERRVAMMVSDQATAMRVCESGELLAVLPDAAAQRARLRRISLDVVPPTEIFALTRPTIGPGGKAQAVVDAVREAFGINTAPR